MVGSNARYISQDSIGIPVKKKQIQLCNVWQYQCHHDTSGRFQHIHDSLTLVSASIKRRKNNLQLERTHLHQQCWTRRLHACSPRRVRARRSRSAWRDRNPCSPALRSLPLDAPGTWTEFWWDTITIKEDVQEFNTNVFQRAHGKIIFLLLFDNVQALVYAGPGPLYAAHFDFPLRSWSLLSIVPSSLAFRSLLWL